MTRYFIAANIWLIFGVVAILGKTNRDMPLLAASSFFDGGAIDTRIYNLIVFALFAASVFFFVLTWKTHKKP